MNTISFPEQSDTQSAITQTVNGNPLTNFSIDKLPEELSNLLAGTVSFDSMVILGDQISSPTLCLHETVNRRKEFLFQRYLSNSFAYDPFYCQVIKDGVEGVFQREDVLLDERQPAEYRKQYHYETERSDELAITVAIDDSRFLALFLGRSDPGNSFSEEEKQQVFRRYQNIKKLCRQLCPEDIRLLIDKDEMKTAGKVNTALSTFATDLLTIREQEVIILMLQGQSNNDIADKLQISVATVKVHRKSIYNKLNVTNLNEFWQLFLNHLVTSFSSSRQTY